MPLSLLATLITVVALAAAPPPALAGHDDHVEARNLLQRGEILPLNQILQTVHRQVPGDVIGVELDHDERGWEYEVKVLTADGRVREVKLDAGSGAVRKVKDD